MFFIVLLQITMNYLLHKSYLDRGLFTLKQNRIAVPNSSETEKSIKTGNERILILKIPKNQKGTRF